MRRDEIGLLIDYMYWVNHRLLDSAARLRPRQFTVEDALTTRSLRATLVHELDVEWSWRLNLRGQLADDDKELDTDDFPHVAALRARWDEDEQEMRAWLATIGDEALVEPVQSTLSRDQRPLWQFLLHIFTHAQQQQADAATLLSQYGQSPGEIGFIHFLHLREG